MISRCRYCGATNKAAPDHSVQCRNCGREYTAIDTIAMDARVAERLADAGIRPPPRGLRQQALDADWQRDAPEATLPARTQPDPAPILPGGPDELDEEELPEPARAPTRATLVAKLAVLRRIGAPEAAIRDCEQQIAAIR